jgi:hypothetical protein
MTFEFILIPHEVNCKSDKPQELILYFSQKYIFEEHVYIDGKEMI